MNVKALNKKAVERYKTIFRDLSVDSLKQLYLDWFPTEIRMRALKQVLKEKGVKRR